jgi:hypothetical protein
MSAGKSNCGKAEPPPDPAAVAAATAADNEATERRRIRALLKLPMLKRTNFLRVRVGKGAAL